ncbi:hypothetical protein [Rheinheimera sp. MM224]|uniref:hypothetical protein n=1 Tax=Rheinheimera sp. MM224 TaxID=3019969 RepID=UPI0021F87614|nr:hypothetical protein [Rheinheimera sp. MM224]CAI3792521.1 hypothetical protein JAMGFMIE_00579 [Rheinheimera sp. MM224]
MYCKNWIVTWLIRELDLKNFTLGDAIKHYLQSSRYLSSMPDNALSERLVHLLNNCLRLDHESMVQLCIKEQPNMFKRIFDVFAETALRHGSVSSGQYKNPWDTTKNVMIKPSKEVAEKIKVLKGHICDESQKLLLRFSSYQFMDELINDGGLFLQSASAYKMQENISIKDDELKLTLTRYLSKSDAEDAAKILRGLSGISYMKSLEYTVTSPDYLVLCLTDAINYRMIADWNAEAAVIIHNPDEFYKRLTHTTKDLRRNKMKLECGNVRYVDPYFDSYAIKAEDLPFCKSFKFAYQSEYRFVIRNSENLSNQDRKLFLGPLTDIATLVDLR